MKKIKFFALALTLLMGISFTSCLNNDSEAGYDGYGYLKIINSSYGGLQLKDLAGNIYLPTMSSVAALKQQGVDLTSSDYNLAIVYWKWVEETQNGSKAGVSRQVDLVAAQPITKGKGAYSVTTLDELVVGNEGPVMTLQPEIGYGSSAQSMLYGAEYVIIPVQWRMKNDKDMLKQHTFNLYYVNEVSTDENLHGNKTLALYLLHDKGTDNEDKKNLVNAANSFSFDIRNYMEQYKNEKGAYPNKVIIKAKVAMDGATLPTPGEDGTGKVWTDFEIDASFLNTNTK